jgi:hypothetical protein
MMCRPTLPEVLCQQFKSGPSQQDGSPVFHAAGGSRVKHRGACVSCFATAVRLGRPILYAHHSTNGSASAASTASAASILRQVAADGSEFEAD